jgi:hypothetical protein
MDAKERIEVLIIHANGGRADHEIPRACPCFILPAREAE